MIFKDIEEGVIKNVLSVFGDDITYLYAAGGSSDIKGAFDNKYVLVQNVQMMRPTLTIQLSDLTSAPAKGDTVLISNVNYKILESQPDGLGASLLILQKV